MKTRLVVSGLILLMAGPAFAESIHYAPQVTGKRERKNIRHYLFVNNLSGDKQAVYDEYGYTPHRVRIDAYGHIREQWTYYELGKQFTFDACDRLVESHDVTVEHRRSWAYQRDVAGYDEDVDCDR
jgi:hypothetical protein